MIEYICARWRDAVADPPNENWVGKVKYEGKQIRAYCNLDDCGILSWFDLSFSIRIFPDPGDQWLDVTDMPAIPREKVQSAVDGIYRDLWAARYFLDHDLPTLKEAFAILKKNTGLAPSEPSEDSYRKFMAEEADPAVPREQVQALADVAKNRIRHGEIVQASEIYGLLVQEIEHYTGVTPTEVL